MERSPVLGLVSTPRFGQVQEGRGADSRVLLLTVAEAISTRRPVFVEDCRALVEGFESRSWGEEMPETALIIPGEFSSSSGRGGMEAED